MTKMTRKEMFAMVLEMVNCSEHEHKAEIAEFIEHQIELLEKKSTKSGPTKAQIENEALATELYEALVEIGKPVTITEFQKQSTAEVATLSNQKLTSLMRALIADGKIVKTVEKKKSYFSVA